MSHEPQSQPPGMPRPAGDPERARLEGNLRLLSQRLEWLEERSRNLEAENLRLRGAIGGAGSSIERAARERASRIVAAAQERANAISMQGVREAEAQMSAIEARIIEIENGGKRRIEALERRAAVLEAEDTDPEERSRDAAALASGEQEAEGIRADAQAEAKATRAQVNELLKLRESLVTSLRASLLGFAGELQRAEERRFLPDDSPTDAPEAETPRPVPITGAEILGAEVEVRVEPVRDIEELIELERAFHELAATTGVFVRSFEGVVAVLDVTGPAKPELLAAMRSSFPFEFDDASTDEAGLAISIRTVAPEPQAD